MGIFSGIKNAVSSAAEKVNSTVSSVKSSVSSTVSKVVDNSVSVFENTAQAAADSGVSLFENTVSNINSSIDNIVSDIESADSVGSLFSSVGEDIKTSITNYASDYADYLESEISLADAMASSALKSEISLADAIASATLESEISLADAIVSATLESEISLADAMTSATLTLESGKSLDAIASDIASDIDSSVETTIDFLTDDGEDDGKISIATTVCSAVAGVGNTVINSLKGMVTDSEGKFSAGKTLLSAGILVATGAACMACPAVGVALGAVGVVTGGIQIGKGVYNAATADTDEEAKQAWQNIGGGAFTAALSAVGTKASLNAMKSASTAGLNGGSAMDEATTATGKVSGFFKDAASSTKNNVSSIASKIKTAVGSADDTVNSTQKTAAETIENTQETKLDIDDTSNSAQKNAAEAIENTQKSQLDACDQYYLEKAKNGTLTKNDVSSWYEKEYMKIRDIDNSRICENSALQEVVNNPSSSNVYTYDYMNGYWKMRTATGDYIPEVFDRASLNVTNDPQLIAELDNFMSTGTYTVDGKTYVCENMVDFMYKTASDTSKWFTREDPITIYFKGEANSSTLEAITNITAKYANGSLHNAKGNLVNWFAVEQSPDAAMINALKSSAWSTNKSIYQFLESHGSNYSSGAYESLLNIIDMINNAA